MKKRILYIYALLLTVSITSCAYKTCATYSYENNKNIKTEKTIPDNQSDKDDC